MNMSWPTRVAVFGLRVTPPTSKAAMQGPNQKLPSVAPVCWILSRSEAVHLCTKYTLFRFSFNINGNQFNLSFHSVCWLILPFLLKQGKKYNVQRYTKAIYPLKWSTSHYLKVIWKCLRFAWDVGSSTAECNQLTRHGMQCQLRLVGMQFQSKYLGCT